MSEHLCITVHFLGGTFHGRADEGEPEWPPSPLRLFQALVSAAAAHWNEHGHIQSAAPALRWLESQPAPAIVAPRGVSGAKYRTYVPDNIGDITAAQWSRGHNTAIVKRVEKDVRPTHLSGGEAVHYLWLLPADAGSSPATRNPQLTTLLATVPSITHVGWGVDMVAAHAAVLAEADVAGLQGQRWRPTTDGSGTTPLRVPVAGTLADLERKHGAFLLRTQNNRFAPVPPLQRFAVAAYADDSLPARPPTAAFSLLQLDASGFRTFDPVRDGMRVAGMLRHAAGDPQIARALGWSQERVNRTILGHGEAQGATHVPVDGARVAFLPLPSLEARDGTAEFVVGSVRRVLLTGVRGQSRAELLDLARLLSGQMLIEEKTKAHVALLSRLPDSDRMAARYHGPAAEWATVAPVILPGHDDRGNYRRRLFPKDASQPPLSPEKQRDYLAKLDERVDQLLRQAIRQAGFSDELAARAELAWRNTGFCRGVALASEYAIPEKLGRFRRLHVRLGWRDAGGQPLPVTGPLCLGGGRFGGLGLFAPIG